MLNLLHYLYFDFNSFINMLLLFLLLKLVKRISFSAHISLENISVYVSLLTLYFYFLF